MTDVSPHPYYDTQREAIREELEDRMLSSRSALEAQFPSLSFEAILILALKELNGILRIVPYAGGDLGRMTPFFKQGAGVIALGRELRSLDAPQSVIGSLMRAVFPAKFYELQGRFALPGYGDVRRKTLGLTVVLRDEAGTVLDLPSALRKNNTGADWRQIFIGTSEAFTLP